MSVSNFIKELSGKRVEGEIVSSAFYSFIASSVVFLIFYFTLLKNSSYFTQVMAAMIVLAILSYSILSPTFRQVKAYRQHEHTYGMMIGMTVGMLSGFMCSLFVGATNGMFVGGMFGMIAGVALGIWMGSCCGVMGVLEGAMAGLMGGLMGAMTSVMTLNDHIILLSIAIFIIFAFIIISLWYMVYLSTANQKNHLSVSYVIDISLSAILTALTLLIMVFGPRSFLF